MSRIDDGGPAYPRVGFYPDTSNVHREDLSAVLETRTEPQRGASLRDLFAAHALTGILSSAASADGSPLLASDRTAARWAYEYADAMLYRRSLEGAAAVGDEDEDEDG